MPKAIVTGGAGFIGCNTVRALCRRGWSVVVVDNLSRRGSERNLTWLRETSPGFEFIREDVRDQIFTEKLLREHRDAQVILHLSGQVAVTTSVADPRGDFRSNLEATLNLLEACRLHAPRMQLLFSSTNKVYGSLEQFPAVKRATRYELPDCLAGVDESVPLDFHSPYGCSKGAADQYVRDYARIYGLSTVVFRQSCIYGPRQMGVEDQGWVAWFLIAATLGRPITIFGDGLQVRDLLYVDDLVELYLRAIEQPETCRGEVYNVGGGPENSLSLVEFLEIMREEGLEVSPRHAPVRPGDQPYFVANNAKAGRELGWRPRTAVRNGIAQLAAWVRENRVMLEAFQRSK
jgi:CDP-paratose 2-epimerase